MGTNPALKKLGFSSGDRLAIIHADDVGMCQASLPAISDLYEFGLVSSSAVMVPCPWFQGAAAFAQGHHEADIGVHLTLNSEWSSCRWGPVSTRDPASGLIDQHGYFYDDPEDTQEKAGLVFLEAELRSQIKRAVQAGLTPTHVDTHMFCLGHPRLFPSYLRAGLQGKTLPVTLRCNGPGWKKFGFPEDGGLAQAARQLESAGFPMIDDIYMMNLETHENRLDEARQAFADLTPGITHFILHPAADSPELRAMAPDWRCRVADYQTFMSDELKIFIQQQGVQVIGYRALKDLITPHHWQLFEKKD